MAEELYTVDQVAELLNLHVRTVRSYVREGRLKAVRIGKSYRIAGEDLAVLTGRPASTFVREPVGRQRYVEVSSIVEIDAISPDAAIRLMNTLVALAKSHDDDQPLRIENIYNQERGRLKVILTGSIGTVASFLKATAFYLEQQT
ncbi:MAG TPA: helix-turn-helix domain-containing protein [Bryobacteraceae bacterium]|jgi:excisionase family DNA binding protein|nr:helix-turn-helix domain-containing protein [Bryobacteraceae bacterium]